MRRGRWGRESRRTSCCRRRAAVPHGRRAIAPGPRGRRCFTRYHRVFPFELELERAPGSERRGDESVPAQRAGPRPRLASKLRDPLRARADIDGEQPAARALELHVGPRFHYLPEPRREVARGAGVRVAELVNLTRELDCW